MRRGFPHCDTLSINGDDIDATPQDGAEGEDYLTSAAATDDGGVVVGGYTTGLYNGVDSEGRADFVAIKMDSDGAVEWHWQAREGGAGGRSSTQPITSVGGLKAIVVLARCSLSCAVTSRLCTSRDNNYFILQFFIAFVTVQFVPCSQVQYAREIVNSLIFIVQPKHILTASASLQYSRAHPL